MTKKTPAVEAKDGKEASPEKVQASHILLKAEAVRPLPEKKDIIGYIKQFDERTITQKYLVELIRAAKIEASEEYKHLLPPAEKPEPAAATPAPEAKKAEAKAADAKVTEAVEKSANK